MSAGWRTAGPRGGKAAFLFATALAAAYLGICGFMFLKQESFVYFPERRLVATPQSAGLRFEEVAIRTADGVSLGAWWVPTREARGAVILAHGNAGNISHRLDKAQLFCALGLSTLLFDYRGYGESGGTPSEAGTYLDMSAAVDFATRIEGVPSSRLVFFGESLGGAVAVEAAARSAPGGLVLESTFTSLPAMARRYYPWLPAGRLLRIRYDSLERIGGVRCPVLVLHSPQDDVVPYAMGQELFAAAGDPKAFAALEGGHNDGGVTVSPGARAALEQFLDQILGPSGESDPAIE